MALELPQLTPQDFASDQEVRWCPGCGDYSILAQMKKVMPTLGIPREGFGFSNNPGLRFGPPRFESVLVDLGPEHARQTIRLRYLL